MTDADFGKAAVPRQIPARMLNEFAYCPRLFFLEWVQGQFEENPDTAEGSWRHRAVDRPSGRALLPDEGNLARATSVHLGSEQLGVVAVIDIVEPAGEAVRPVDVKKGRPPEHRTAWEPEMVQLCAQGLLLREHGYRCDDGVLYFAETNERRVVTFDEALVQRTLDLLSQLRVVASERHPPAPLIDSPKCPRCSLVGLCLPDEVNNLADRSKRPARRLTPRDSEARPIYVGEHGVTIGLRSGRVEVSRKSVTLAAARLIDVSQINVQGNAQVTTQLLRECFHREIPVCWFSSGGWFQGIALGLPSKNIELRRRQFRIATDIRLRVATRMIEGKIRNCRTLLRRNERTANDDTFAQLKALAVRAVRADSPESLLGIEGAAARLYFSRFGTMFRSDHGFDFTGRNRRPPKDPVNCVLSYLYALLVKDLTAVVHAVGFDPYLGVFHQPRFGRPALSLDLAEEFRPLISDSAALQVFNNGEVSSASFVIRAGGVALTSSGRRAVISAYERRLDVEIKHPLFGYKITYRRVLEVQARLLGAYLMDEIPDYVAFTTR